MRKVHIRVTDLDSYSWYESTDQSLEDYLQNLRGEVDQTEAMARGIAFHKLMEHFAVVRGIQAPQQVAEGMFLQDGILFDLSAITGQRIERLQITEMPISTTYYRLVPECVVEMSARVDGIIGSTVIDWKTTSQIDMERLTRSWQWRCYLSLLPQARRFKWYIFAIAPLKTDIPGWIDLPADAPRYKVTGMQHLEMGRYAGMDAQVKHMVWRYVDFLLDMERAGNIQLDERGAVRKHTAGPG